MKAMPDGPGLWIDQLSMCEGGDLHKILNRCKSCGIKWLAFKSGEASLSPGFDHAISVITELFHTNNIKVYTYNYSKPSTWPREIEQIQFLLKSGVDGHILHAEIEWKTVFNNKEESINFLKALRGAAENAFIGYSTFGIKNHHSKFPYAAFNEYCDAVFPRIFWTEFNWPLHKAISVADGDWHLFGLENSKIKKPIYPVAITYGGGHNGAQGSIHATDLNKFITHYGDDRVSFFSYDAASSLFPKIFDVLMARFHGMPIVQDLDVTPSVNGKLESPPNPSETIPVIKNNFGERIKSFLRFLFHL